MIEVNVDVHMLISTCYLIWYVWTCLSKSRRKKKKEKLTLFSFRWQKNFTYLMRMSSFVKIFISSSAINVFGMRTRELSIFFCYCYWWKKSIDEKNKRIVVCFIMKKDAKKYLSVRFLSTVNGSIECISNEGKKSSMRMI